MKEDIFILHRELLQNIKRRPSKGRLVNAGCLVNSLFGILLLLFLNESSKQSMNELLGIEFL